MPEPTMLFKVLGADGRSCHGGNLQWPLPTLRPDGTWAPGAAVRVEGPLVPCENGIHVATARQVLEHWLGERIYVLQWRGELLDAGDKWVVREARLLHPTAWDDRTARHFACDCAEQVMHLNPDARVADAIRVARLFAEGRATRHELAAAETAAEAAAGAAWAAAGAAWAAAGAAWAAAGAARAAARVARTAARAAWAAARAARTAARDAARDAAIDWQEARLLHYLKGGQPDV